MERSLPSGSSFASSLRPGQDDGGGLGPRPWAWPMAPTDGGRGFAGARLGGSSVARRSRHGRADSAPRASPLATAAALGWPWRRVPSSAQDAEKASHARPRRQRTKAATRSRRCRVLSWTHGRRVSPRAAAPGSPAPRRPRRSAASAGSTAARSPSSCGCRRPARSAPAPSPPRRPRPAGPAGSPNTVTPPISWPVSARVSSGEANDDLRPNRCFTTWLTPGGGSPGRRRRRRRAASPCRRR